jgi:hypothetical protein
MPATSSQKRKANEDPPGEDSGRPAPALRKDASSVQPKSHALHLPAPMWGHVLDYLPYGDVRSALLVSKIIANEAVKYVRTLNIMKACQMDGPSTRSRFPNVGEVNVLCLVRFVDEPDQGLLDFHSLCQETATKFVPFLSFFGKLERVFAGGLGLGSSPCERRLFDPHFSNDDHNRRFLALIEQVLGAYKVRLLPNIKSMDGIIYYLQDFRQCVPGGSCSFCRDVCRFFPVRDILNGSLDMIVCIEEAGVLRIICQRAKAKSEISDFLTYLLRTKMRHFGPEQAGLAVSGQMKDLRKRLEKVGFTDLFITGIQYLTRDDLSEIDDIVKLGFDPRIVSREELYKEFKVGLEARVYDVFVKSTFDALVARGFAFDEKDLIILDETKEPALSEIPTLIHGIDE